MRDQQLQHLHTSGESNIVSGTDFATCAEHSRSYSAIISGRRRHFYLARVHQRPQRASHAVRARISFGAEGNKQ